MHTVQPPQRHSIEKQIIDMLSPYDSLVGFSSGVLGFTFFGSIFLVGWLWQGKEWGFGMSLLAGGGVMTGALALSFAIDAIVLKLLMRKFEARFPYGSAPRRIAREVLHDMSSKNQLESKLLEQLPEVRFHLQQGPSAPPEQQIDEALDQLSGERADSQSVQNPDETAQETEYSEPSPRKKIIPLELNPTSPPDHKRDTSER